MMRQSSLSFFLLSLATCAISGQAQAYQPQQVYAAGSTFIEGQAMYVSGGSYSSNPVNVGQMFWIDLSTPWSTSSPAYKRLLDGIIAARVPSTLVNNNNWFFLVNQTAYIYNIADSTWTNITTDTTITPEPGLAAAADPNTGNVYVPNIQSTSTTTGGISLFIFSFADQTIRHDTTQANLKKLINYNAVWAPTLKSMLVFGGNIDELSYSQNSLYTYNLSVGWSTPSVSGDIPPPRTLACLVPAYSGTKMILYGGFASSTTSGPPYNDIYILDVATFVWTRGSSSTTDTGRGGHACAVSGDYLIVWGGCNTLSSQNMTMVYNMKSNAWTSNYYPPAFQPSPPSGPQSGPSSTSSVPLIAGCAGGAVVLILLAAGFIWRRKRFGKALVAHSEAEPKSEEPQQKQDQSYQMFSEQQPQHIYQPPVIAADPAAGYYQPLVMSTDQATGYYQPIDEMHHIYQPPVITNDQAAGYYQTADQQPQIYQLSPVVSDQSTAYCHDSQSPQVSAVTAATVSSQTNYRNPQILPQE